MAKRRMDQGRKAVRIVLACLREPAHVPLYVRHSLFRRGSTPLDLGLPWFSYSAIDYLAARLRRDMTVFEFGGGGSTVYFAARVQRVVTVEHDDAWSRRIAARLAEAGQINVELVSAPADFRDADAFASSPFPHALPDDKADIIVIDSYDYEGGHHLRPVLFPIAERHIKPGGTIVVDDSWRYPQLRRQSRARRVVTKSGLGPMRKAVTSTDFYEY